MVIPHDARASARTGADIPPAVSRAQPRLSSIDQRGREVGGRHQSPSVWDLACRSVRRLPVVPNIAGSIERQKGMVGSDDDADQGIASGSGVAGACRRGDSGSTLG